MLTCGINGISQVHFEGGTTPTQTTFDIRSAYAQTVEFIAGCDAKAMKTEELFEEGLVRNASAFGGDLAYIWLQHCGVQECWATSAVVNILTDRDIRGRFEADGP